MNNKESAPADGLRAGVVGLGMIGGGVAVSLNRSGRTPVVHDIRPDAADHLPGSPAVAASPADLAGKSDVVLVAVVSADQARAVITGESGVLSAAHPGLTVVLLSTVALPVVRELAGACEAAGVGFLDAGVTPGDKAAQNGLVTMVGGNAAVLPHALPVLYDFAKDVIHCGPVGAGMATKLARNIVTYGSWRAVAEAATLASAAGVDPSTLVDVITKADPEGATLLSLQQMQNFGPAEAAEFLAYSGAGVNKDDDDPVATVQAMIRGILPLMDKDLAAVEEAATELGITLPLVAAARSHTKATLGLGKEVSA